VPEPALTIVRDWSRADPAALAALALASAGQASDAGGGSGALDGAIRHLAGPARLLGSALPVRTAGGDNLAPYAALAVLRPGDVLVLASDAHAGCALIGDHLGRLLRNAGAAGIVTDGRVRDLAGLREVGLPVYACGTSPRAPRKAGPGTVGLPVTLGGVTVHPGDLVIADDDGVVVLPRDGFAAIAAPLESLRAREAGTDARARAGALEPPGFDAMLERAGVRWLA
jgi:4-hydroxy-4-methyl-2-oxoglutarate aldolase